LRKSIERERGCPRYRKVALRKKHWQTGLSIQLEGEKNIIHPTVHIK
jgi:hypothetical protein